MTTMEPQREGEVEVFFPSLSPPAFAEGERKRGREEERERGREGKRKRGKEEERER